MDTQLKAYQVGENDIVAAYTPEGALEVLVGLAGEVGLGTVDVSLIEEEELDVPVVDEDGNQCPTIRQMLADLSEPTYLFGWD